MAPASRYVGRIDVCSNEDLSTIRKVKDNRIGNHLSVKLCFNVQSNDKRKNTYETNTMCNHQHKEQYHNRRRSKT
jgi:hypothetical protein